MGMLSATELRELVVKIVKRGSKPDRPHPEEQGLFVVLAPAGIIVGDEDLVCGERVDMPYAVAWPLLAAGSIKEEVR